MGRWPVREGGPRGSEKRPPHFSGVSGIIMLLAVVLGSTRSVPRHFRAGEPGLRATTLTA